MTPKVMYVEVEGLYAALTKAKRPHLAGLPLVFVRGEEVVDLCPLAARRGGRKGMSREHARHLIRGGLEINIDGKNGGLRSESLARWGAGISPRVQVEDDSRIFLQLAANDSPRKVFSSLVGELFGQCGHSFLAAAAANKLIAKIAVMLLREREDEELRFPACSVVSPQGAGRDSRLILVKKGQQEHFLRDIPVSFLWPFPQKVRKRLQKMGVRRIGQLNEVPAALLKRHFGLYGLQLSRCVRGDYPQQVADDYPPASLRWKEDVNSGSILAVEKLLDEAAEYLAGQLAEDGLSAGALRLRVVSNTDRKRAGQRELPHPASGRRRIFWILTSLFRAENMSRLLASEGGPANLQVEAFDLQRVAAEQVTVFSADEMKRTDEKDLDEITRRLQRKHSPDMIYWGRKSSTSRKEKMFAFWDPLRRAEKRVSEYDQVDA